MKTFVLALFIVAAFVAGRLSDGETTPVVTELEHRAQAAIYHGYVDALRDAETPAPIEMARHD